MKTINPKLYRLIELLNDLSFHSGRELGEILGISRTAVWKLIRQLEQQQIEVLRDKTQGYCFTQPLILVDEQAIKTFLHPHTELPKLDFHILGTIESTNQYLKRLPPSPSSSHLCFCISESQNKGRGRFGRVWHSPFGKNIYCSSRWQFECGLSDLSHLSLLTGLAVVHALEEYGITDLSIKWPNDVYYKNQKLCGILIDIMAESHGIAEVIVGIGLNVNMSELTLPTQTPWCSLSQIIPRYHDRNHILALLIKYLTQHYSRIKEPNLLAQWKKYDYLCGKYITVEQPKNRIRGIAQGIDAEGRLLLLDKYNITHRLNSGETSLNLT